MTDEAGDAEQPGSSTPDPASGGDPVGFDHRDENRTGQAPMVLAAVAVTVPVTLLATSVPFDLWSQRADMQFVFARGGFFLTVVGVLTGVASTVVLAWSLGKVDRASSMFRQGRAALLLLDAALIWFGITCLRRSGSTYVVIPVWMLGLNAVAVACLLAALALLVLATLALLVRISVEVEPAT